MFQELKINGTTLPRPDGDLEFSSVLSTGLQAAPLETMRRIIPACL